jgi:hypothetical protein
MPTDFRALFAPDDGPDFNSMFAPDEISEAEANRTLTPEEQAKVVKPGRTWGDVYHEGMANAPQSALNAGKNFLLGLTPIPALQRFNNIVTDPRGESERTRAHYKGFLSEEGIKEKLATDPVGTVGEVLGYAPPMRAVKGAVTGRPAGPTPMPRAAVREGPELVETGGARMEQAKQNPSRVDKEALITPLQSFREKTKTTVITSPTINNIAKRLETAHIPNQPGAMEGITKVGAKPKPDVTLTELHGHAQRLDEFVEKGGKNRDGRINPQGRAAIVLKNSITEMIKNHPENADWNIGKGEVHRGKMDQELGDLLERAQGRTQWKNGDEAGALAAELSVFRKNRKNRYKLTPEARKKLAILEHDKKGRLTGAFGLSNNSFGGNVFARGLETAVFGFPGALAPIGQATRTARNARILAEFEKIREEIRAGGPVE